MKTGITRYVALLRGINVSGRNMIPMAKLRSLCAEIGWSEVATYINSGNVIFSSTAKAPALEDAIERSIEERFGHTISVIVRSAAQWPAYLEGNPFPRETTAEPKAVMLALSKKPPRSDAATLLRERAVNGEKVEQAGDAIWIHYGGGMAKSKLAPALFDRAVGSPVTTRNWRSVVKIGEMLSA
jgi:uncharacterized protein (DUF1697 family)